MSDITYQQEVVYQQQENALQAICAANVRLDDKANVLITGGSIVAGLIVGTNFLALPSADAWANALSVLMFAAFLLMLAFASKLWSPRALITPGPGDVETMYNLYISRDADEAYHQALTDLVHAVTQARIANDEKTHWLAGMFIIFQAQIILLILALLRSLFSLPL